MLDGHFDGNEPFGARQIMVMDVAQVKTSCDYAVPFMTFTSDRPSFERWAEKKGETGLRSFRDRYNRTSVDGFETGFLEPEALNKTNT